MSASALVLQACRNTQPLAARQAAWTHHHVSIHHVCRCKNTEGELPFLYEDHAAFTAFPTFPLVLPFKGTSHDVVPFPSPTLFSFPPGEKDERAACVHMCRGWDR